MKTKPTRHKKTNTFQFKPFSERITEINIDIFDFVRYKNEKCRESRTYFHQTLEKWNFLNLTDGYSTFQKQVRDIIILPQLVYKEQYVVDTLMEYLKKRDPLFLQPILELVVAVAKDLQGDFYERYFLAFFSEIIHLLQTKNAEQIEHAFNTMAYLFRHLWRFIVRDIKSVIPLLLPLLSETQPDYINKLAAESFAFVVRKITDKDEFFKNILDVLKDTDDISGYGKLFFEVVFGVAGQFHSRGEQVLLIYFNTLQDQSVNQRIAYEVLKEIVICILQNIHPQKCDIMWHVILKMIDNFIESSKQLLESSDREHALILVLRLVNIIISYKNGKFIIDSVSLIKRFIIIMNTLNEDNILREVFNASIAILLASRVILTHENSSQLLLNIMAVDNTELLYSAVEKLMYNFSFEILVLPRALRRSISTGFDSKTLLLFAKIILKKASPCLNGINLPKWEKYVLDVRNIGTENIDYFLLELKTLSTNNISLDAMRLLIILPHLKPLHEEFKTVLKNGWLYTYQKMLEYDSTEDIASINRTSFIFLLILESIIHILEPSELHEFFVRSNITIADLVNKNDNKYILNAIDLCLTYFSTSEYHANYINSAFFDTLNNAIVKKLNSPYSSIRLIVAHLYSLFSNVEDLRRSSIQDNNKTAMELVYLVEREPTTVNNYRTKLLHLQALEFQSHAIVNLNPKYYEFPLRCLIGNLYVNFSLLWKPISIIIASYGNRECSQFWPTYLAELTSNSVPEIEWTSSFDCHVISSLESQIEKHDDKPDFENYKKLLWKSIAHFSHYAEMKNRDLTGLFIDFVNTNFSKSNSEDGKYCNIEKRKDVINANNNSNNESEEEEEERNEMIKIAHADIKSRSDKVEYLLAQLEVFEKVLNPRMLHREAEMYQIYLDLLSSKNANIQKTALNCLFAYKHEYLLPYKESLYSLISEKNLKNELAHFKLDRESNVIKEAHRENLMPIILRIIYAKMIMKTGMRTGGKASGSERRKMILRFLSGTQEDEMIVFVQMAFRPFKSYISLEMEDGAFDLKRYIEKIMDTIDLSNVIPPKRMQSTVKLLAIMMEEFGGKMSTRLLPCLLRMLICILAEVTGILHKTDEVYPGYLPAIKNVRTSCIDILTRFFKHFEDYNWKRHEIDAVCHVAIFPWLQKLPVEGIHSPTALLKLFMAWGENPRYHPLFAKHREDDESITPLPYIVELLLNSKSHQSVVNAILLIIENLLTLQDYDQSNEDSMQVDVPLLPIPTNLLDVEKKGVLPNGINYGSAVLLPHVPRILEFLKNKLQRSNRGLNKTELLILSRISEYVTDAETCDTVLKLILPILVKKASGNNNEIIVELLTTVMNLIKMANKPEIYLRDLAPLMSVVSDVPTRKLLLQLYGAIVERSSEEYRETMMHDRDVLLALNAWDRKWIDQPDFERRLDAFDEISKMTERNAISLEFGVTVIHNCFFFLKTASDLAIRDCAGQCLKLVGCRLAKEHCNNSSNRRYLMDDTILALTRKGIMSKNENVRHQSVALLGCMALECADVHPILRDMSLLVNPTDREVDFFENMQHLQLYRRARALLKFCTLAKTLRKPFNSRTLTQFILPLCSMYLCNEAFINKNSLIDAAIDTIGIVCRFLPWHHYEIILRHYLNKLKRSVEFQKQLIRIVVAILDSFHYDLSKYKEVQQITQVEVTLETNEVTLENNATLIGEDKVNEAIGEDVEKETEEILEEALNDENVENVDEVEQDNEAVKEDLPIIEKQTLLSQSGARKVMFSISNSFLPQLNQFIIARTQQDNSHKINKKTLAFETEEDDLLRVPIAIALVKLLQKMPGNLLDANLPGIFMKLCTFLKSRMESIRRTTRKTLQEIMITLGPKYLHYLLKEMNTLLTKGFQVHVLAYTVQSVLNALKPFFQKFDIDRNLQSILSVCKIDLFGLTAEEKEIAGIVKNVSEAKSTKSFDILHILAEYITETCLLDLIMPLNEMLMKTHSYKMVDKITECLQNVSLGLVDNTYIPLKRMLEFLYGITSQSLPDSTLEKDDKNLEKEKSSRYLEQQQSDCFIIPPEPKNRMGIKATAKITKHANVHVIKEFGLTLFHIFLKRNKISCMEYKSHLERFVPVLSSCLNSDHVKLCTVALKCLSWMLKMDLTLKFVLISEICTSMFKILHKYATAELSKGDNFDLVKATFKCMSVFVEKYKLNKDQLKCLFYYVETDLNNNDKPATAFALLKIIINRKIFSPILHTIMKKVVELSILAQLEDVRSQARTLFLSYLMKYPHTEKHLHNHIDLYLAQFEHEGQSGRLSALKMIHTIIKNFPSKPLSKLCEAIFMDASFLVVDEDLNCREVSVNCIEELLIRIPTKKDKLFRWTMDWLNDSDIAYREMGARICGIFVTTEKKEFDSRFDQFLPILVKQFHENFPVSDNEEPDKFVKLNNDNLEENSREKNREPHVMERLRDLHIIQVTFVLVRIAEHTSFLTNERYKNWVDIFTEHCQSLLGHLHYWVRLNATKFIGYVLEWTFDNTVEILNSSENTSQGYMYSNPLALNHLVLDLLDQLYPDMIFEPFADQVVKCLIIIAKIFTSIKTSDVQDNNLSLSWLIRNLRKAINVEITQAPKSISVRKAVFKFIGGIVIKIRMEHLNAILFSIMSPLVREITITEGTNVELCQVAKEVISLIKKALGNEQYIKLLNQVQQKLDIKKTERKKARTQQSIVAPDVAAKRKLAKQQKKKESKKRKIDNIKENKIIRKRRKVDELI
ncbi:small subunit processome component 20 homolog [Camponotus floridanus]|uniref:small subunit processome component 20 homolog n=1 Tax=Camponotus floridanus TaxID=104421 RepID=UPI000DC68A83|nr:small subunit processome component 20 homolog [Camponotus floridanus]